jgi:hypothetical protein
VTQVHAQFLHAYKIAWLSNCFPPLLLAAYQWKNKNTYIHDWLENCVLPYEEASVRQARTKSKEGMAIVTS